MKLNLTPSWVAAKMAKEEGKVIQQSLPLNNPRNDVDDDEI
jgi:hypothetical protein